MSNPIVTVTNSSTHGIFIAGDPNWDDQQLLINGEVARQSYKLAEGKTATVGVQWDGAGESGMLGVIFSQEEDYDAASSRSYQLEVGQEPGSGNLGVTSDFTHGQPEVRYALSHQTPWSATMTFTNVS